MRGVGGCPPALHKEGSVAGGVAAVSTSRIRRGARVVARGCRVRGVDVCALYGVVRQSYAWAGIKTLESLRVTV